LVLSIVDHSSAWRIGGPAAGHDERTLLTGGLFGGQVGFHFGQGFRHGSHSGPLLAIQVRFAHREPPGDVEYPLALYETEVQDVVDQPFGCGVLALTCRPLALDGVVQDRA
jgi:hypothetical protein